ncbi:MAG TPA: pitrilysin family protein [Candidatus Limnocylindria bacterium]|nr:pitrilysin family protein [Candidatus Limnocylindria bacterium]
MYQATRLSNGLTVLSAAMPHMASVSLGVWVGVGGRHEPAPLNGISHFIEHMLFKGTRRRSAAQISQAVEGIGGYLNAFTDEENTCFYSRARADRLPELLDVLLDMFLDSVFAPAEINKERDVIKEELAMYRDQPAEHVHDVLNAAQFPGHSLGRPVIGSVKTLNGIRREHLTQYLASHYVAGATVIAAAGDVSHERLVQLVTQSARRFRPGGRPSGQPVPALATAPVVTLVTRKTEQTNFSLGLRTCSRHDERRFALRLLNVILGENMSSRLFQKIREEHGLTYNIQSSPSFWDDCGDLVVNAGLAPEQLARTLRLLVGELRRLRETLPGRAEFGRARDYVLGQFDLGLEGTEHHMMALGEHWLGFGRLLAPAETKARLSAVTPAEVRSAARDFFRPERMTLALVSPRQSAAGLAGLLRG